jgi:hypothetical protein
MPTSSPVPPPLTVSLSRLGPAIAWLRDRGVSAERLASVFRTTAGNIRQIDYRQRRRPQDVGQGQRYDASTLGIRPDEDASLRSDRRSVAIDRVRERIAAIRSSHIANSRYLDAATELRRLHAYRGFPSSLDWLRILSRLHREQAWFLVHSGRTTEGIDHANRAIAAARRVYQHARKPASGDAKDIVDAALILAHAHLMRQEPRLGLQALQLVEDASDASGLLLGSDFYRQRGVVLLQAGVDEPAIRYFRKSGQRMLELGEGSHPLSAAVSGDRYVCLLTGNFERAQEIAHQARETFGSSSMEASVSGNFAVACSLSIGSRTAEATGRELLASVPTAKHFGHQTTLSLLLSLTPDLALKLPERRAWITHALYINAAANR